MSWLEVAKTWISQISLHGYKATYAAGEITIRSRHNPPE
jgi:hypothetical protein